MNRQVWREVMYWNKKNAAVPIEERVGIAILWTIILLLTSIATGNGLLLGAVFSLAFPWTAFLLGLYGDYRDARKRLEK